MTEQLNELSLFAGAGGGLLGGHLLGFRTVCAVEKEPYCREVLLRRQRDGLLPLFPIWDDVRTFDGRPWRGIVDVVTAGFPCQPFSVAGKRAGKDDERNLWPETIRTIREVGPRFALLENVPHLLAHDYFGEILGDLAEAGFDAEWEVVSAGECGAPHRRERIWILAYAGLLGQEERKEQAAGVEQLRQDVADAGLGDSGRPQQVDEQRRCKSPNIGNGRQDVALADGQGLQDAERGGTPAPQERDETPGLRGWWDVEPDVGRTFNGLAERLDLP